MKNKYIIKKFKAFLKTEGAYEYYIKMLYKYHKSSSLNCVIFFKTTIENHPQKLICNAFPWMKSRHMNFDPHQWSILHNKWQKLLQRH